MLDEFYTGFLASGADSLHVYLSYFASLPMRKAILGMYSSTPDAKAFERAPRGWALLGAKIAGLLAHEITQQTELRREARVSFFRIFEESNRAQHRIFLAERSEACSDHCLMQIHAALPDFLMGTFFLHAATKTRLTGRSLFCVTHHTVYLPHHNPSLALW